MKLTYIVLIVVFFLGASQWAEAIEQNQTVTYLHTVSYHANRTANFNESNYGIGVRHYLSAEPLQYVNAGVYKNSESSTSIYVGVGYQWKVGELNLGINAGIISGYSLGIVLPYVVPTINYKKVTLIMASYPEAVVHMIIDVVRW